jgi:hypothetical protein
MPKRDKEIEELIKKNPKLAKYIEDLEKSKSSKSRESKGEDNEDEPKKKSSKNFSLMKDIKNHKLYKISNRDKKARTMLDDFKKDNKKVLKSKGNITPGQMVMFKYLNPKNKEELPYYDASPCTIFFGSFNSKEGRRVLGFNVHYFPPAIRYSIMNKIFNMYQPFYKKYFETGLPSTLDTFDYKFLTDELEKHDLSFAVRMYIPSLIGDTFVVPPEMWSTALMTEGWFKKETRAAIMNYFKKDAKGKKKISTGTHSKGKAAKKKK